MCQDGGCELGYMNCPSCTLHWVNNGTFPYNCQFCLEYRIKQQHQRNLAEIERLLEEE